jgi:hypothetical protein
LFIYIESWTLVLPACTEGNQLAKGQIPLARQVSDQSQTLSGFFLVADPVRSISTCTDFLSGRRLVRRLHCGLFRVRVVDCTTALDQRTSSLLFANIHATSWSATWSRTGLRRVCYTDLSQTWSGLVRSGPGRASGIWPEALAERIKKIAF